MNLLIAVIPNLAFVITLIRTSNCEMVLFHGFLTTLWISLKGGRWLLGAKKGFEILHSKKNQYYGISGYQTLLKHLSILEYTPNYLNLKKFIGANSVINIVGEVLVPFFLQQKYYFIGYGIVLCV